MAQKSRLYTFPNGQPSDGQKVQLEFDNAYEGINNIDATQIQDGSMTTAKLANGAVTDAKIATGAVTNAKLEGNIEQSKILDTGYLTTRIDKKIESEIITNGSLPNTGNIHVLKTTQGATIFPITSASSVSAEVIETGSGDNVQAQLLWLKNQIKKMVLEQIPEASITLDKLATELANKINSTDGIGDLTALTTTEKTNLVGAVNELDSQLAQKANKTQQNWISATLLNGWVDSTLATGAKYFKDEFGIVHLSGGIESGATTAGTVLLTLPTGYRPRNNFPVQGLNANQNQGVILQLYTDGSFAIITAPSSSSLRFNLSFRAEN